HLDLCGGEGEVVDEQGPVEVHLVVGRLAEWSLQRFAESDRWTRQRRVLGRNWWRRRDLVNGAGEFERPYPVAMQGPVATDVPAGCHRDVLLAVDGVGHRWCTDTPANLE